MASPTDRKRLLYECRSAALGTDFISERLSNLPHAAENYYKFLYHLARRLQPTIAVELGVYRGVGLAHIACGWRGGIVIGVDNDSRNVPWHKATRRLPNARVLVMDSVKFLETYVGPPIDLLHIDTEHNIPQVSAEYRAALPHMASGGIICIDDLNQVKDWWRWVRAEKVELPDMHVTGYGAIVCPFF